MTKKVSEIFLMVEVETWSKRDVVLQKEAVNTTDRACEQRGSSKENGNKKSVILSIRKRGMKFLGHMTRKWGLKNLTLTGHTKDKMSIVNQRVIYLTSLYIEMIEQGLKGDSKKTNISKSFEIVERHDRKRPEGKQHIKEDSNIANKRSIYSYRYLDLKIMI